MTPSPPPCPRCGRRGAEIFACTEADCFYTVSSEPIAGPRPAWLLVFTSTILGGCGALVGLSTFATADWDAVSAAAAAIIAGLTGWLLFCVGLGGVVYGLWVQMGRARLARARDGRRYLRQERLGRWALVEETLGEVQAVELAFASPPEAADLAPVSVATTLWPDYSIWPLEAVMATLLSLAARGAVSLHLAPIYFRRPGGQKQGGRVLLRREEAVLPAAAEGWMEARLLWGAAQVGEGAAWELGASVFEVTAWLFKEPAANPIPLLRRTVEEDGRTRGLITVEEGAKCARPRPDSAPSVEAAAAWARTLLATTKARRPYLYKLLAEEVRQGVSIMARDRVFEPLPRHPLK